MTPTALIIVVDRGGLKAYRVNETPTRGASLQLVQAFDITDAHGRYDEKLTDQAGRFPVSDGNGRHANAIAERTALETENDRRIAEPLRRSASIHSSVTELLPAPISARVVEHVKSDLVKIEPSKLHEHFRSLQPL